MKNQNLVIFGASGGLGSAIVQEALEEGYAVVAAVRQPDKMRPLVERLPEALQKRLRIEPVEVTSPDSLKGLANQLQVEGVAVHHVLSALGSDVRKPFLAHTPEDIRSQLLINLEANIHITQAFLPLIQNDAEASILLIGGFGDGSLALPYYSVDVASRAGLKGFVDSINREIGHEGYLCRVQYFCPSPADTEAERPYHDLWRSMGTAIASPKQVAQAVLTAMTQRRVTTLMGDLVTQFLYGLNKGCPKAANSLYLHQAGKKIKEYIKHVQTR